MNFDLNARLESLFGERNTAVARDLKLNLKRFLEEGALPRQDALLALLATAVSVEHGGLAETAREALKAEDLGAEQIQEAAESAAIMGMLNTYYRFKHMVGKEEDYRTAGLRMTSLAKPALGKTRFEMLALAVSVLNGCEYCIRAHENVLRDAGMTADQVHDLARIAAVVKGIKALDASA